MAGSAMFCNESGLILLLYVDDLLIASEDEAIHLECEHMVYMVVDSSDEDIFH